MYKNYNVFYIECLEKLNKIFRNGKLYIHTLKLCNAILCIISN